jgi:hypothetical protein
MMNADEIEAAWEELTEREKEQVKEDRFAEYLDECNPEQRARAMWDQS